MSMNQIRKNGLGIVAGVMILLLCTACTQEPNTEQKETPTPTGCALPTESPIPTECLEESGINEEPGRAQELLDLLLSDLSYTSYGLYNHAADYIAFVSGKYEYMDELVQQDDYVEVLLKTYQEIKFLEARTIPNTEENREYKKAVWAQTDRIVLLETMLAKNEVFDRMSEEQKEQTLVAVRDKVLARGNGKYNTGTEDVMVNGFFAYVRETRNMGSKWYEYIMNSENASAKSLLDKACYPMDWIPAHDYSKQ